MHKFLYLIRSKIKILTRVVKGTCSEIGKSIRFRAYTVKDKVTCSKAYKSWLGYYRQNSKLVIIIYCIVFMLFDIGVILELSSSRGIVDESYNSGGATDVTYTENNTGNFSDFGVEEMTQTVSSIIISDDTYYNTDGKFNFKFSGLTLSGNKEDYQNDSLYTMSLLTAPYSSKVNVCNLTSPNGSIFIDILPFKYDSLTMSTKNEDGLVSLDDDGVLDYIVNMSTSDISVELTDIEVEVTTIVDRYLAKITFTNEGVATIYYVIPYKYNFLIIKGQKLDNSKDIESDMQIILNSLDVVA